MKHFGQYDMLDLTAEQRTKIETIHEEYEREFPPLMEKVMAVQMKKSERLIENLGPDQPLSSLNFEKEYKAEAEALIPLTQLHARVRAKILAVLTKEQTGRLEKILADAPKYLVERLGLNEKQDDSWKDSWKPGDPIPESFKKAPRKNFPAF
ncbi:MAG: Spy/CpxP family protein refolding chaperone [Planctomycetaceae bacterium]|nr:Spy/CpxP family protein refolding chaperone [Planctomycetaceae bacterium]